MKIKYSLITSAVVLSTSFCYEQKSFMIDHVSKEFSAKFTVERCEDGYCGGPGTVKIFKKNNSEPFQVFRSTDLYFPVDDGKIVAKVVKLDEQQSPLIFDDFNFDGNPDLAIPNGMGGYGMGSFNVYVYNVTKKQFIRSKELTDIASQQGLFQVDHKRKRLISNTKSGCCWHQTTEYTITPNKGLVKVYEKMEDGAKVENIVIVTEQKLVNAKWSKTTKRYKLKDYYKN